jgi:3-dehydroquinate dehydratase-2
VRARAKEFGWEVVFRQSNHEGDIVDWIQEAAAKRAVGVILNPAGHTTTSIAILDAILGVKLPTIEVHVTNIHARESFRHDSYISKGARGVICGLGIAGYALAIEGLAALVGVRRRGKA